MIKPLWSLLLLALLWGLVPAFAGDVEVQKAVFSKRGSNWSVSTTLKHADTGWDHYADAWRVVDDTGKIFGTRKLLHPHEQEQPFTRSLSGVTIPTDTTIVYVEAHDSVHGWSSQRLRVDLNQAEDGRLEVNFKPKSKGN